MDTKEMQRWSAIAAGTALAAAGLKKGGRNGMLLSLAGGALAAFSYANRGSRNLIEDAGNSGRWQMPQERLEEDAKAFSRTGGGEEDAVHEASDESFPASDAPSFTPTTSIGGHERT